MPSSSQSSEVVRAGDDVIDERYKLVRRIGHGGMGGVWEAIDLKLDCPIAIKLVRSESEAEEQQKRFLREAKLSAAVQHPGVVRVTDYGVHEGQPFIAMELLSGESLHARMERGPSLTQIEAVQICVKVLRGLAAAHAAGVVHRDIKPDNVQLVEDGDSVFPKLLDFGISLGRLGNRTVSAVTTNGHVFGTPMYMSPEHARGLDVDGRSDLYAVGVMLYELLCGEPPFEEGNIADLTASIMRDIPPSPHVRSGVPPALSDVVMKALAKNPADRFSTARGMASALVEAVPGLNARADETTGSIPIASALSSGERAIPPLDPADETADEYPAFADRRWSLAIGIAGLAVFIGAVFFVVGSSEADATHGASPAERPELATSSRPTSTAESPPEPSDSTMLAQPAESDTVGPTANAEPTRAAPAAPEPTATGSEVAAEAARPAAPSEGLISRSRGGMVRAGSMGRTSMRARRGSRRFRTLDY